LIAPLPVLIYAVSLSTGFAASQAAVRDAASPEPLLAQQSAPKVPPALPVYTPPRRGTPSSPHRVGGGTRSGKNFPSVTALVPDHTGLTISDQPTLFWFLTEPLDVPLEIVMTETGADGPILEYRLPPPASAGIQHLHLADHNVHLVPGKQYVWSIAMVIDAAHRSRDVFATGTIERVESSPAISSQIAQASRAEIPVRYAAAGLWYDALASVSDLIESSPGNADFHLQRAALLDQVGLNEASQFDRSMQKRGAS
jgi:hypothetical protein